MLIESLGCRIVHGQASFVILGRASYQQSETNPSKTAVSAGLCRSNQFTTMTAVNSRGFQVNRELSRRVVQLSLGPHIYLMRPGRSAGNSRKAAVGS
jgi:hypothetical protein